MSLWRSILSLTRPYTCLVVPRTDAYLKVQNQSYHKSHVYLYENPEAEQARRKAAAQAVKEREQATSVEVSHIRPEELIPGVVFPTKETHSEIFDGVRFDELPILNIRATKNNTIASCDRHNGGGITLISAGAIGFKNARKGTSAAATAVGIDIGNRILLKGINNVRVVVKGIGIGRLACIKGIQTAGLNVISITDNTPVITGKRPKKQRRL